MRGFFDKDLRQLKVEKSLKQKSKSIYRLDANATTNKFAERKYDPLTRGSYHHTFLQESYNIPPCSKSLLAIVSLPVSSGAERY